MAIQPVDLQLAYLAAPQSAAVASGQQQAPAAAQAAVQAAFAAHVDQREETVTETPETEGAKIRPDGGGGNAGTYDPQKRRRRALTAQTGEETAAALESSGEKHFIDTTA